MMMLTLPIDCLLHPLGWSRPRTTSNGPLWRKRGTTPLIIPLAPSRPTTGFFSYSTTTSCVLFCRACTSCTTISEARSPLLRWWAPMPHVWTCPLQVVSTQLYPFSIFNRSLRIVLVAAANPPLQLPSRGMLHGKSNAYFGRASGASTRNLRFNGLAIGIQSSHGNQRPILGRTWVRLPPA